ncbi:sensor histidine kinase [Candidatus Avoscillospira sp. LCP25S3_F1]|uniref:sensor histidine kinase n=1 Tax=Candidatus Avoscillospira sp. LCP25S3_F1 TaxID=3438825 RepID=UPI003F92D513
MSGTYPQELAEVLNLMHQPVLLAVGGEIVFRNDAAMTVSRPEAVSLSDYLPPLALEQYRTAGPGTLELTVELLDGAHSAVVRKSGAYDTIAVRPRAQSDALRFDAMTSVARAVRRDLTALFDSAAGLFPLLEELEDPDIQDKTARFNQGLYRLLRLSGNLSDAGAYLSGQGRGCFVRQDVAELLQSLHRSASPLVRSAGLTLELQLPDGPVMAAVDGKKLQRAVHNLLSNAMRFTPAGGTITLSLVDYGHAAHITVRDNGEGMSPAQLSRMFDHYEDREPGFGDDRWGVGLGLPLVRMIANLHGGTVVVNSEQGQGTTVTMSISRRLQPSDGDQVRSPIQQMEDHGGYDVHVLELSDALPRSIFDSRGM